jgi:hypothetical protein
MALLIDTNQNAYPSAANPDGSAAFPITVNATGVAQATATSAAPTYVNGTPNPLSMDLSGNLRVSGGGGGGGGAVTAVSGAFVDGAMVTMGTEADASWSGSGSGTLVSLLKGIYGKIAGGGPVTAASGAFVDGSIVTIGTEADAAWSGSGSSTLVAALKAIYAKLAGTLTTAISGSVAVTGTFWQATQPVSGTFWQATQPVSGTVGVNNFPATQPVSGTFWQATQPVSGTFWQATQPVSAASLPLPANAAQETGGNLATIASAVTNPLKVDGSGVIQPISAYSLPLPDGAATDASLMAVRQTLDTNTIAINSTLGTPMQQSGGSVSVSNLPAMQIISGSISVGNFPTGQQPMASSVPVAIAGDQPIPAGDRVSASLLSMQLAQAINASPNGFVPAEVPSFLAGW